MLWDLWPFAAVRSWASQTRLLWAQAGPTSGPVGLVLYGGTAIKGVTSLKSVCFSSYTLHLVSSESSTGALANLSIIAPSVLHRKVWTSKIGLRLDKNVLRIMSVISLGSSAFTHSQDNTLPIRQDLALLRLYCVCHFVGSKVAVTQSGLAQSACSGQDMWA